MNAISEQIKQAWRELPEVHDGWRDVKQHLYEMNLEQERRHRKGAPYYHGAIKFSATDAAKLFAMHHILDAFAQPDKWTVDDILCIRNEVLYAQAYTKKFSAQWVAWAAEWRPAIETLDYAKLMAA